MYLPAYIHVYYLKTHNKKIIKLIIPITIHITSSYLRKKETKLHFSYLRGLLLQFLFSKKKSFVEIGNQFDFLFFLINFFIVFFLFFCFFLVSNSNQVRIKFSIFYTIKVGFIKIFNSNLPFTATFTIIVYDIHMKNSNSYIKSLQIRPGKYNSLQKMSRLLIMPQF